jgi:hypothetical protein
MNKETAKWIFGSLAIAIAVYATKEPVCLWAFVILAFFD